MARRMQRAGIVAGLADFVGRAPGTDAERRAALWLMGRLRTTGRGAHLQAVWVRPRWPLVHAIHAALAVTGTLLSVTVDPAVGLTVIGLGLVSMLLDPLGVSLARSVTPRRATQNVVSPPPPHRANRPVRLVISAAMTPVRMGWRCARHPGAWPRGSSVPSAATARGRQGSCWRRPPCSAS